MSKEDVLKVQVCEAFAGLFSTPPFFLSCFLAAIFSPGQAEAALLVFAACVTFPRLLAAVLPCFLLSLEIPLFCCFFRDVFLPRFRL